MELNHLRYFYFVAKEGGFSKAARALNIAQPALTRAVKNLERDLGVTLLDRSTTAVALTKPGNDIYRRCQVIFAEVHAIHELFTTQDADHCVGAVNVGAAEVIANYLAPPAFATLLAKYPRLYPQLVTSTASELVRLVSEQRLDLALLLHVPTLPEGVKIRQTYSLPFHLVVAADAVDDRDVCASFIGSREVDDDDNKSYPTLERLRKVHPRADIKLSCNSLSVHRQLVLDRRGVSVLPDFLIAEDIAAGRLTCLLGGEELRFAMNLVTRGDELRKSAAMFVDVFWRQLDAL